MKAAWIPCDCCENYLCTIHQQHAHDCECPPIDEWETDPYMNTPQSQTELDRRYRAKQRKQGIVRKTVRVPADRWEELQVIAARMREENNSGSLS